VTSVAVLGSTGSIGRSALEVIGAAPERLQATALSAHSSVGLLGEQAGQYRPRWLAVSDPAAAAKARDQLGLPAGCQLLTGPDGLEQIVREPSVDVVLTAIVGSAGLRSTLAALEAGKRVALANKETLVVAGPLVMHLASRYGAQVLPVDSEHSAVFQALQSGRRAEVRRIVLTASGGPFRNHTAAELETVTIAQALKHPTWQMGAKITIDARWLFDLDADEIEVMVHPQSIVHSFVEFIDGSVVAQMGPPDMKLPIQYALTFPERWPGPAARFDWTRSCQLDFEPADFERFPALALGLEVARTGGTSGAVVNAANEAAVAGFLAGELPFTQIVPTCRRVLEQHDFEAHPGLDRLLALDRWARQEVSRCLCP
jgi:1-deoxy-D-xylulose-5-phosphate reductoisomerase